MIQEEMEFATQVPQISVGVRSLPPSLYLAWLVPWQPLDFINVKDVTGSTVPIISLLIGLFIFYIYIFFCLFAYCKYYHSIFVILVHNNFHLLALADNNPRACSKSIAWFIAENTDTKISVLP